MSSINQVSFAGNLTADPRLIRGENGKHSAFLKVALNAPKRSDGTQPEATFVEVIVFGQMAENAAASFKSGDAIVGTGRLTNGKEENVTQNGKTFTMTTLKVIANRIGPDLSWQVSQTQKNEKPQQGAFDASQGGQQGGQQGGFGQGQAQQGGFGQGQAQGQGGFGQGQQQGQGGFGQGQQGGFGQGQPVGAGGGGFGQQGNFGGFGG